eukprot:TRINITY_DN4798_c0_g1_i7.p1 TRINITY_DN4798_c0_g1~~TRINITY_DN4798_c0_g1_i7.p1  ORF type:complete len:293 (+),score=40.09 TRINITY_DN4798_c0_g1_i7:63-881(+)
MNSEINISLLKENKKAEMARDNIEKMNKENVFHMKASRLRNALKCGNALTQLPLSRTFVDSVESRNLFQSPLGDCSFFVSNTKSRQFAHTKAYNSHSVSNANGKRVSSYLENLKKGCNFRGENQRSVVITRDPHSRKSGARNKSQHSRNNESDGKEKCILHYKSMQMFEKKRVDSIKLPIRGKAKVLQRAMPEKLKEYLLSKVIYGNNWKLKHSKLIAEQTKLLLKHKNPVKSKQGRSYGHHITECIDFGQPETSLNQPLPIITIDVKKKSK